MYRALGMYLSSEVDVKLSHNFYAKANGTQNTFFYRPFTNFILDILIDNGKNIFSF